jgi:DNA primase
MDAYAVTLAGEGRYVGVAPLGTSLTEQQAAQLAQINRDPIVATDPDIAGQVAAERDYWLLTPHGLDPTYARFPIGLDPADVLTQRGPDALLAALDSATPLVQMLLDERVSNINPAAALLDAVQVLAARRPEAWEDGVQQLGQRLYVGDEVAARFLRDAVATWDVDPRRVAGDKGANTGVVRSRLEATAELPPAQRWATLANELDARLVHEPDWPATATMLQQAHEAGHDIPVATRAMVNEAPLGGSPTRDLRYRIVAGLDLPAGVDESLPLVPLSVTPGSNNARADQRYPHSTPRLEHRGPAR